MVHNAQYLIKTFIAKLNDRACIIIITMLAFSIFLVFVTRLKVINQSREGSFLCIVSSVKIAVNLVEM